MRTPRLSLTRWLVLALAPLLIAGAACNRHRHDPAERAAHVQEKLQSRLDLNDTQTAQLKSLTDEVLATALLLKAERDADMDAVFGQLRGTLDRQAIGDLVLKRQRIIDEKLPGILDKLVDFHASLDNEQKAAVAGWAEKFRRWRS